MGKQTALKIELKGFDEIIDKLRKAGANVEAIGADIAQESGKIFYDDLKSSCASANVPASLTSKIELETKKDGPGRTSVSVGWSNAENYDPKNPQPVHKVVFLNYGTPRRYTRSSARVQINGKWVTVGTDRGYEAERGFIATAKKSAQPKIKKFQKAEFEKVMEGLGK